MEETFSDLFVTALESDVDLAAYLQNEGEEFRIYAAGSLGQGQEEGGNPQHPELPYMVWNELPSTASREVEETSNSQTRFFAFYVYDIMGSHASINAMLRLIRSVVKDLAPFETTDEGRCTESRWLGLSGFVPDPAYDSTVRFGTARLQASQ